MFDLIQTAFYIDCSFSCLDVAWEQELLWESEKILHYLDMAFSH